MSAAGSFGVVGMDRSVFERRNRVLDKPGLIERIRMDCDLNDAESRTRFLGYPVDSFKLWVFVFSAVLAGIAGALYVPQIGIINPSEFAPINSIEAVIWVAVGGRGTLYGAAAPCGMSIFPSPPARACAW
jgi:hypothetical protein